MQTLIELLIDIERLGSREAARWTNGLRTLAWSYAELHARIASFSRRLDDLGVRKGDRLMIWGENRPEWIAAFWGAVARGVEVVPVDFRFSADLVRRIQHECAPKLVVCGSAVDASGISADRLHFDEIPRLPQARLSTTPVTGDDIVEIVYTSGTTGEPKGVAHRHRNICSNLDPFQREIARYRKWATPFQPVRILTLLPLSHMFGQSQGLFIPVLLGGAAAFTDELRPAALMRIARNERISVIVSVPRILETLQQDVARRYPIPAAPSRKGWAGVALRWWTYRRIHSGFGWKFWAFVVGGARLEPELESFWARLGYLVIQGYGLTEASPVVAVNHPFHTRSGSLGKVVPGQDVKIAPDGEILVRGESVTGTQGEWLRTGDLGEIDRDGWLYYRGRKKDMIVTREGLNVHPEDVERVLNAMPEIRDSAVIASADQVHAALILSSKAVDAADVVGRANERLETHQRIRGWTVWPGEDFPRTPSTMKVKRHEVARRIAEGTSPTAMPASALDRILAGRASARLVEDLGLSSLDRVELLSEFESRRGIEIDEETFAGIKTVGELTALSNALAPQKPAAELSNWPLRLPARAGRWAIQQGFVFPLFRHYIPLTAAGLEHLDKLGTPALFAANHTSHLDTIALAAALPPKWRRLLSPAMSKDYFRAWFAERSLKAGLLYGLARLVFNAYPLPQEMAGMKKALEYTAELVSRGFCPLVYPEGRRTPDGRMHAFRPGIGMMAVQLRVPVVPVHIEGLYDVYSIHHNRPKRGPARIKFGPPLYFPPNAPFESAASDIQRAVKKLAAPQSD